METRNLVVVLLVVAIVLSAVNVVISLGMDDGPRGPGNPQGNGSNPNDTAGGSVSFQIVSPEGSS